MWVRATRKSKSPEEHNTYHPRWDDAHSSPPYVFLVHTPDMQRLHVQVGCRSENSVQFFCSALTKEAAIQIRGME